MIQIIKKLERVYGHMFDFMTALPERDIILVFPSMPLVGVSADILMEYSFHLLNTTRR